jgi:hypothetical protein
MKRRPLQHDGRSGKQPVGIQTVTNSEQGEFLLKECSKKLAGIARDVRGRKCRPDEYAHLYLNELVWIREATRAVAAWLLPRPTSVSETRGPDPDAGAEIVLNPEEPVTGSYGRQKRRV